MAYVYFAKTECNKVLPEPYNEVTHHIVIDSDRRIKIEAISYSDKDPSSIDIHIGPNEEVVVVYSLLNDEVMRAHGTDILCSGYTDMLHICKEYSTEIDDAVNAWYNRFYYKKDGR
jgi:hypothetical protein